MEKVWIRTHVSSGDVTIHKEPPRPHMDGMKENKFFNREGEQVTEYLDQYGSPRYSWIEVELYK